jgi:hypothetical protein
MPGVYYEEARRVLEQVHMADTSIERLRDTPPVRCG